jgi:thioredoxin 1
MISSIDEIIKNYENKILVLNFCEIITPEFEQLTLKYPSITFSKIESKNLYDFFEVSSVPTIIILSNCREVLRSANMEIIRIHLSTLVTSWAVYDFYADWCGPCKKVAPLFEQLSKDFKHVEFKKINTDEQEEITQLFNISALPTFVILKNDIEVYRVSGIQVSKISDYLTSHAT